MKSQEQQLIYEYSTNEFITKEEAHRRTIAHTKRDMQQLELETKSLYNEIHMLTQELLRKQRQRISARTHYQQLVELYEQEYQPFEE